MDNTIELDVVIVGGGFGGVYCGKALSRTARKEGLRVGLISDQNYMTFQPMLAEVAGASLAPRHVVNPLRLLCRGIRILRATVQTIDPRAREMTIISGRSKRPKKVLYQHLVLCPGAVIDLSRVPGMSEHALLMQTVGDAMVLRARIINRFEEASLEKDPVIRKQLLTFAVVGGGYSGVETAGQILDMYASMRKFYPLIQPEEFRVILVHSRERILPTLSEELSQYARQKLERRGLQLILGKRVKAVTASRIRMDDGSAIEVSNVISTVGNASHPLVRRFCTSLGLPEESGYIITDSALRVPGIDNVWAIGDAASNPLHGKPGEFCPPTAQFAMRHGTHCGKNILRTLKGEEVLPFTFTGLGELATIGHQTAVASVMGFNISGFFAWFMWRSIYLSKLPGIERKLRVMIEWTLDLFFSRDTALLNPRYTRLYRKMFLEPGDPLTIPGEPASFLYLVKSGKVQVRDESTTHREIKSGQYFGERALLNSGTYDYEAVATEPTEVLAFSGEVVVPLLKESHRLRSVIGRTSRNENPRIELERLRRFLRPDAATRPVSELMVRQVAHLRVDQSIREAVTACANHKHSHYPVLDRDGKVLGILSRESVYDALKEVVADLDQPLPLHSLDDCPRLNPDQTGAEVLRELVLDGSQQAFITDEDDNLIGTVSLFDLIDLAPEPTAGQT